MAGDEETKPAFGGFGGLAKPAVSPAPASVGEKQVTPAFGGFAGFGKPPATADATQADKTKPAAAGFGGFGGFGKPAVGEDKAKATAEPKPAAAGFGGFAGFGAKSAAADNQAAEAAPAETTKAAPGFGGFAGFGKPAATPPVAAAAAAAGGFAGFGKPAAASPAPPAAATPAAPAPPAAGFGGFAGFGKPAAAAPAATPATAPAPAAASKGGFSFGAPPAPAPAAAKPASSPFGAPAASPFGDASAAKSPFALPSPTVAPAATPAPAFPVTKAPAPGGFSFGAPPVAPAKASPAAPPPVIKPGPVVPSQTSAPATTSVPAPAPAPTTQQGVALSDVAKQVPKVGTQLTSAAPPKVTEPGMTGEFAKAYLVLQAEFDVVKKNAQAVKAFAAEVGQARRAPGQAVDYDERAWALGDLARLADATGRVGPGTAGCVAEAQELQRRAGELQSLLLKAETKREEAARFIRARSDPVFAKLVRVRQLGPEQVEYQKNIRLQVEAVRARVEQVEEHVASVKEKVRQDRQGKSAFKAPTLDSVNRAVRNITSAVKDKAFELDELAGRLDLLNVGGAKAGGQASTPAKGRGGAKGVEDWLEGSPLKIGFGSPSTRLGASGKVNGHASTASSVVVASDAAARQQATEAALGAVRAAAAVKKAMLAVRTAPVLRQVGGATAGKVEIQSAFANGPVTASQLPKPRGPRPPPLPKTAPAVHKVQLPPLVASPAPAPKATVTAPAPAPAPLAPLFPAAAPPPSGFAGFTGFTSSPAGPPPAAPAPWSLAAQPAGPAPGAFPVFKAPAAISFSAPFVPAAVPSGGGSRSGGGGRSSSRTHAASVKLKSGGEGVGAAGSEPAKAAAAFDWGPMPAAVVAGGTGKREVGGFVSLTGGAAAPAPAPAKPAFSFGLPPAPKPAALVVPPPAPAVKVGGFGLVDDDDDEEEGEEGGEGEGDEFDEDEEYGGQEDEEWDGEEDEEEPEGLEAISEREEE